MYRFCSGDPAPAGVTEIKNISETKTESSSSSSILVGYCTLFIRSKFVSEQIQLLVLHSIYKVNRSDTGYRETTVTFQDAYRQ